jgi:hypothetical protein
MFRLAKHSAQAKISVLPKRLLGLGPNPAVPNPIAHALANCGSAGARAVRARARRRAYTLSRSNHSHLLWQNAVMTSRPSVWLG